MQEFTLKTKAFKRLDDPISTDKNRTRYVCYVQANSFSEDFFNWMDTNPREQKMSTDVAKKILESLKVNENFHELNKGMLFSAQKVTYDNYLKTVSITFDDATLHGNIDGGHTLRAVIDSIRTQELPDDRYVFVEILTGIESCVEIAAARNTAVPVDLKSIEELKKSFKALKEVLKGNPFEHRISYKMNEHYEERKEITDIDVREIIAILNMFSQKLYPKKTGKVISSNQPVQSYSGKETSLRKFIKIEKEERDVMLYNMKPIVEDIFRLWDKIEMTLPAMATKAKKRYGTKNYSKFDDNNIVGKSFFGENDLKYIVPKGLMYPLVGAFRSLVEIKGDKYLWKMNPIEVWEAMGDKLVSILLDEKSDNPDAIAKNTNLWSNLFKEVFIYAYM